MSTARPELPRPTALAVVLVTVAGVAPLAVVRPILGAGTLAGVALGLSVRALGRSSWWTVLATAALPPGLVGAIATLWLSGSPVAILLTLAAIAVGISTVGVLAGRLSPQRVALVEFTGAVSALAVVTAAFLTLEIQSAGGVSTVAGDLLSLPREGAAGLVVWVLVTGAAVRLALVTLPPALTANLRGQPLELSRDPDATPPVLTATLVLALVLAVGTVTPVLGSAVTAVGSNPGVRGALTGVTVLAVCVAGLGALARGVWATRRTQEGRRAPPVVALGVGALVGATVVAGLAVAVDSESAQSPTAVFVPTIAALALVSLTARWVADRFSLTDVLESSDGRVRHRRGGSSGYRSFERASIRTTSVSVPLLSLPGRDVVRPETLIPAGLVGAATLTAIGMDRTPELSQVGVLVAIAAALFVRTLFSRGRASSRAVGVGNVARLPQSIWVGWTGALALAGLAVGAVGIALADLLSVTLSVPATVGVVSSLVAFVAGIWLLLR